MFSYLGKSGDTRGELYRPHVKGKLVVISFITVGEMYFGAHRSNWDKAKFERLQKRIQSVVVAPYDIAVCEAYARLKAGLPKGRTIEDNDLWIAACAVRHSIPLVTHNRRHFDDFKELIVISEMQAAREIEAQQGLVLTIDPNAPAPRSSLSKTASED